MARVNIDSDSLLSNHNIEQSYWNFSRRFTSRIGFNVLLPALMIIDLMLVFVYSSEVKLVWVNSFHRFDRTFQNSFSNSPYGSMSMNDLQLYKTLIERAKNRSNRYYLNDFAYFRMIRNEFSRTDSAVRLRHDSDLSPLLPTILNSQDVLFIVMGSVAYSHKSKTIVETWLQWSQGNYFIFADANNSSLNFITLPQLFNKSSRNDAQHRQLMGSQWLIQNKSELVKRTKWFVFVDDDTWVNVPALLSYLQLFDHRLLLSIGYIWDDIWVLGWSFLTGGAGIVFSQGAFIATMPAIYRTECPFKNWNDVTIMHCQKQKGVTKIHSDRFSQRNVHDIRSPNYVGRVTFHHVNDAKINKIMTCNTAAYWKSPINGCNVTNSEDLPK